MWGGLKKLFGKRGREAPAFPPEQRREHDDLKRQGMERVLGTMYDLVGHAIIPFEVGGAVDMYYFPGAMDGTGFATMELIAPDGSGPKPSRIGTYELVAFTRHRIGDEAGKEAFDRIERAICGIFTVVGRYSFEARLNPGETIEVPAGEDAPNRCLILDEYAKPGIEFTIGGRRHGLLLLIEVFRSEMDHAMKNGSREVLARLKETGHYPFSDLDREPVC